MKRQRLGSQRITAAVLLLGLLAAAGRAAEPVREMKIGVLPGMKYDLPRFTAKPGEHLRITFHNGDMMQHNLVFVKPNARMAVLNAALALGGEGPAKDYIPDSPDILAHTPILDPGQTAVLDFIVPAKQGVYTYLCTFPGHGYLMYGPMYNFAKPRKLLAVDKDKYVSPAYKTAATAPHFYHNKAAMVQRMFLPETGPASIAVGLDGGRDCYCFDAGECRLRFAWSGGFIDADAHWAGNGHIRAMISGGLYYRALDAYPIHLGDPANKPAVKWHGYRLVSGLPEFRYDVDGTPVTERIEPLAGDTGLVRHFTVEADRPVLFVMERGTGVTWSASAGSVEGDVLKLTPEQAKSFTVTLKKDPRLGPPPPLHTEPFDHQTAGKETGE